MKKNNKYFFFSILGIILLSTIYGLLTRQSIKTLSYDEFQNNSHQYIHQIQSSPDLGNELNADDTIKKLECESDLILTGKFTGERILMNRCVLSKVEIKKIYRGNISYETIDIYEPNSFNIYPDGADEKGVKGVVFSISGCELMKKDKEYLFLLKNPPAPNEYRFSPNEKRGYIYTNNALSKIPIVYNEDEYKIQDSDNTQLYKDFINCEQTFSNKEDLKNYEDIARVIKKKYVAQ